MKVLVTGADGFVGKNLRVAMSEQPDLEILPVTRSTTSTEFTGAVSLADAVIHLAGINRPQDPAEFIAGNVGFTAHLCEALRDAGRTIPIAYASSAQAQRESPYAASKRAAEERLIAHARDTGTPLAIYRWPNVFGKWGRPNYNSAVATFCHNIARDLPIRINDPAAPLQLVYIDDVVTELLRFLSAPPHTMVFAEVTPVYSTTVGALAAQIQAFGDVRKSLVTERVGNGLVRALYATYVSYLPPNAFAYEVPKYEDPRGAFVEMLKTKDSGQVSAFTAHPGVTRGGHYHHSKSEKFLVIKGLARFRFRHLMTGETHELNTAGTQPTIVETIPGWAHDITNIGEDEMVVLLWANEIFDRSRPDTVPSRV